MDLTGLISMLAGEVGGERAIMVDGGGGSCYTRGEAGGPAERSHLMEHFYPSAPAAPAETDRELEQELENAKTAFLVNEEGKRVYVQKVKYSHDALIDHIIANPRATQVELAMIFGYNASWLSKVFNSDAFQARLAERKKELVDPTITMSIEQRFNALAMRSLDIVMAKLDATENPTLALKALEVTAKANQYGAKGPQQAVQVVVALPGKAATEEEWARAYCGTGLEAVSVANILPGVGVGAEVGDD